MSNQLEFYDATVVPLLRSLRATSAILAKAKASNASSTLPQARLIDDMYPLTTQVHVIAEWTAKMVAKFTDEKPVEWVRDDVKTFDDMEHLISSTTTAVEKLDRNVVNASVKKMVAVGWGPGKSIDMEMDQYMVAVYQPNLSFHFVTIYNICRKEGVPIGKSDYLGPHISHISSGTQS